MLISVCTLKNAYAVTRPESGRPVPKAEVCSAQSSQEQHTSIPTVIPVLGASGVAAEWRHLSRPPTPGQKRAVHESWSEPVADNRRFRCSGRSSVPLSSPHPRGHWQSEDHGQDWLLLGLEAVASWNLFLGYYSTDSLRDLDTDLGLRLSKCSPG